MIHILRETHDAPACVAQTLARAGGANRFGEPNFRAVWGWNRLAWIGGRFEDRDAAGNLVRECVELRFEPKYCPRDRWHIERWCAPEIYGSPEDWARATLEVEGAQSIAALGPYPSRGEYEHVFTLEGRRGEFIQLTPTIAGRLARMIERSRALSGASASSTSFSQCAADRATQMYASPAARRGREALYAREAARDRAYDSWADALLHDSGPAFHGVPHVIVPAAN